MSEHDTKCASAEFKRVAGKRARSQCEFSNKAENFGTTPAIFSAVPIFGFASSALIHKNMIIALPKNEMSAEMSDWRNTRVCGTLGF